MASAVDIFVAYQFIKQLSMPWKKMDAYKLGIIDQNGVLLKKMSDLETAQEKRAYTIFHRLVWNLKRLLEKLPAGKTRIGSFAAALWMLKEHVEEERGVENFDVLLEAFDDVMKDEYKKKLETCTDVNFLFEETFRKEETTKTYTNILPKGTYVLVHDVDTPAGTAKVGNTIVVHRDLRSFDEIVGIPVFKVSHPKTGKMLIVGFDDLKLQEES